MANPSPVCQVQDGAGAFQATTGEVYVTPGNTVTIRLNSQAGVNSWTLSCATTDELSSASTVTASLVIDSLNQIATFTAPVAGRTYRFLSQVNGGLNNGVADASLQTTFIISTMINGRRVFAADETTEGDTTFGWSKWVNDIIRSVPTGAGGGWSAASVPGVSNQFVYASSGALAGSTGMAYVPTLGTVQYNQGLQVIGTGVATLANAMLVGGTAATGFQLMRPIAQGAVLGGTTVYTGTDMVSNGLVDHKVISAVRKTTTLDATVTPVFAWNVLDEAITSVVVEANAIPSGGAAGGSYVRRASIRSDGGTATCTAFDYSFSGEHTASGVGFTGLSVGSGIYIGASGATGFVNVKGGPTGVIKWGLTVTLQQTSWQ